jgi:hypothetical protein
MRLTKSFASLSSVILILFLLSSLTTSFTARLVNRDFQSQVSPPVGFGSYSVGWTDLNIPETGNETLPIAIYYPSVVAGEGSNPNMTDSPYPTMLFIPGYSTTIDSYRNFASFVASWGFVFTLVGSDPDALDSERAADTINTLNWLDTQNDNSSFKLTQTMNESAFGVAGHSLGGEAAIEVARSDSRLRVLILIAPFTVSPGGTAYINVPLLILVGSADTITPPIYMAYPLYQNGKNPKFCITMVNDSHLSIIFSCPEYIVSFLKFYLYEDWDYATFLYGFAAQQQVEIGRIQLMYDLRQTFAYEALFKGNPYNVSVYSDSVFQNFSYSEALNQMNFTLAGPPYTTGTANISIPIQFAENYNFNVYFDDEPYPFNLTSNLAFYFIYLAYNNSVHQLTINIVDIVPPSLSIVSPNQNSIINSSDVTIVWIAADAASGLDHFEVRMDESTWLDVDNATSHEFISVADGSHVVYVRAFDKAGNSNETNVSFKVDTTPPSVSIISPSVSIIRSSNVTIVWSGSDNGSGINHYEIKLNNGSWINLENVTSYTYFELDDGNYTVYVEAVDNAGNPSVAFISFTVQTASGTGSLLDNLWFWIVLVAIIVFLIFAAFFMKRRSTSLNKRLNK